MMTKQLVLKALEELPDDADLDELIDRLLFLHMLQRRLDNADIEPTFTQAEVERRLAAWRR